MTSIMNSKIKDTLFVLAAIFTLAACGKDDPSDDSGSSKVMIEGTADAGMSSITVNLVFNGFTQSELSKSKYGVMYTETSVGDATALFSSFDGVSAPSGVKLVTGSSVGTGGTSAIKITGLAPMQTYAFCGFIVCSDKTVEMTPASTFSTLDFKPTVDTYDATGIRFYDAMVNGLSQLDQSDRSSCSTGIVWSDSDNPTAQDGKLLPVAWTSLDADGKYSVKLSGLVGGTTYNYRTYACYNDTKLYVYGPVKSFTTRDYDEMAIDLGLSVKWAAYNLDAQEDYEYGGYYQWGCVTPTTNAEESTYKYYVGGSYQDIGQNICGTEYDAAHVKLGGHWRLPTKAELDELKQYCSVSFVALAKQSSHTFGGCYRGPSGNNIVVPGAGMIAGTYICCYENTSASASLLYELLSGELSDEDNYVYIFDVGWRLVKQEFIENSSGEKCNGIRKAPRYNGYTIRPVWDPDL